MKFSDFEVPDAFEVNKGSVLNKIFPKGEMAQTQTTARLARCRQLVNELTFSNVDPEKSGPLAELRTLVRSEHNNAIKQLISESLEGVGECKASTNAAPKKRTWIDAIKGVFTWTR